MPLAGRDFSQLVEAVPGYAGYAAGGYGSMNGTRANQMNWQIDGVDNNDLWHNIPAVNQGGVSGIAGIVLPLDAVDQFTVQTQSSPESGRNPGATVDLALKSGGNSIHGTLYDFHRNEAFAAASPFVDSKRVNRNYNFGFSVGGPVLKDRLFYFLTFEKQRFSIGLPGKATEPSAAYQALALDVLNNPVCAPVTATCTTRKYGSYAPVTPSSLSCTSPSASGCTGGLMGPSGFWPRSTIGGLPATLGNYFSSIAETGYSYNGVARIDHQFSDKHHLYLRWFGGQGNQIAPLGGSPALGTASSNLKDYFEVAPIHVFNYSAVLNSTLTNKVTNQLLFGANYFNQIFHDFNNGFNTKTMGLFLSPDATNNGQYILGAPNIVIGPKGGIFEQIGLTPPEGRNDLTWHITDIISHSVGTHQLRYGAEVRQAHLNEFYHRRGTGKFIFDGLRGPWSGATGCGAATVPAACAALASNNQLPGAEALADFLAGSVAGPTSAFPTLVGSTIAVGNPERFVVVNAFNLYFQDGWQISHKLNLNFGLRYEYFGPLHSDKKDIANFIPGQGFRIQGAGLDSIFPPDKNNFAPRIGFAYQPTGSSDLVVRGGIGVFYDQINLNPFLDFRPPIAAPQGIEGNPFGTTPVSTYARSTYNWQTAQAGGAAIFQGVTACTDPNCAAPTDPKGLSAYSVSQNFRTPYFFNYNLQVEKGFGNFAVLQIGYVGSQGRKLNLVSNINQGNAFPNFGNILQLNTIGTSNYNSLQAVYRIRSWHGLTSQFAYTWAHALDEISQYRAAIVDDAFNPKLDYGNSDFDTRHLFTVSATYNIPRASWAQGWSNRVVNGWELSSVMNFHRGQPSDENRLGLDLIGDPYKGVSHKFDAANGGTQWWNPAAFAVPVSGIGNLARNKYYGPGFGSVDFSVIKNVPITERVKVQLRADMFNLFNRINLASGVGAVGASCGTTVPGAPCNTSAGFGLVSDTIGDFNGAPGLGPGEAFNLQLVAKIIF